MDLSAKQKYSKMKLMKAMKKLKFWSQKSKNKNKSKIKKNYYYSTHQYFQPSYYPPPLRPQPPPLPPPAPGGENCKCHFCKQVEPSACKQVEPSAPPLPPWLESQLATTQDGITGLNWVDPFTGTSQHGDDTDKPSSSISQEIVVNTRQPCTEVPAVSSSTYQQYMADSPANDLPLLAKREKATTGGLFGCDLGVGSLLIRCFFPCFHISEPR